MNRMALLGAIGEARCELKRLRTRRAPRGEVAEARAQVIAAERALFEYDAAHMGRAGAVAMWKRDSEAAGKFDQTLFKPWLPPRCFACDKPLTDKASEADTRDAQTVYVGPDCARKIAASGDAGYQPPKGGPRLYPEPVPQ